MVCIYCGSKTRTTNSRPRADGSVWRRHHCLRCQAEFTSHENAVLETSHRVLKRSGVREPFYREKLFYGLVRALQHRSTAAVDAQALTSTICGQIIALGQPLISSTDIRHYAETALLSFDPAGASSYRAFAGRKLTS